MTETPEHRAARERRRRLFDTVAPLYQASRPDYPEEVVAWVAETSGLDEGAAVLEVGCGTGQLTAALARLPLRITAIDIGPAMIEAARRHVSRPRAEVTFATVPFEEFQAPDAAFDLIVSATAFHWIDPEIVWARSARLLREGGWLALAYVGERYDEPLRSALKDAWVRRSAGGGAWSRRRMPTLAERIEATGLFEPAVERSHTRRADLTPETVMAVERTRATYLDYAPETRRSFEAELRSALTGQTSVPATIETSVTMARVRNASTGTA